MFNADSKFCRAALVVRLLDFVATLIPKNPARPEAVAPTKNESEMRALESLLFEFATPRSTATRTTKTPKTLYSALKKAIAPSAIFLPMIFIFFVPSS